MTSLFRLCAGLGLALTLALGSPAAQAQPTRPEIAARAYLLFDVTSNQILAEQNAETPVEPASLTKLMSAYLVFQALQEKKISLTQEVLVSERAFAAGGGESSTMTLRKGSKVVLEDLIKGMIVQSGNDATVALAETVGGTVEGFVDMMNRQAKAFGMKSTTYKNPEGLPAAGHLTTARDLAVLATQLMGDFPQDMQYYKLKSFTYNKQKQDNRNLLLFRDPTVDGLKTGYTEAAGYCLIATALRQFPNGPRRLLSIVLGTASKEARANEGQKLLNWGYLQFEAVKLFDARQAVTTAKVWKGSAPEVKLGALNPVVITVPRGEGGNIRSEVTRDDPLLAPLAMGQPVGTLKVISGTQVVARVPVVALEQIHQAGFFGRAWDSLRLLIQ
jgi:serine-type D-Ala-D-Ala carboxypeptidase (penicillin-binding protein 5/6)